MRRRAQGFTLIEIMIVTAIIAGAVMLSLPYITNRNSATRSFLRKFTVLSRELHTRAKLNGATYRLVIDMPAPSSSTEPPVHKYWVERSNSKLVLNEKEEEEAQERLKDPEKKQTVDPKGFEQDSTFVKGEVELPNGLYFDKVELTRLKNPVTSGRAFIHYLPQGLVDEAAVHIKGGPNQIFTIAIHPLTGKAELVSKPLSLKEIKSQ